MSNPLVLVDTLTKAIRAEQRNGCTNAGVMGGFANFLSLAMDKLLQHPLAENISKITLVRLKTLAQNYLDIPPRQRQKVLEEITRLVLELQQALGTAPVNLVSTPLTSKSQVVMKSLDKGGTAEIPRTPLAQDQTEHSLIQRGSIPLPDAVAQVAMPKDRAAKAKQASQQALKIKAPTGHSNTAAGGGMPIQYLKSVGPQRAKLLEKLNINTVEDLLNHFPKRYEDRRNVKSIAQVVSGEVETVRGRVLSHQELKPRRGLKIIKLSLEDGTGSLQAVWFNNPYILKQLPRGIEIIVTGKVDRRFGATELAVADYEIIDADFTPKIVPVYAGTESLPSKQLRNLVNYALAKVDSLMPEVLPANVLQQHRFMARPEAYRQIHSPVDFDLKDEARRRLVFEEFVLLQLGIQLVRSTSAKQQGIAMDGDNNLVGQLQGALPFSLTKAQTRVIGEIFRDMGGPYPMARLVQGDVGSGKTIVAAMALLKAVECGYQGAMMAPTEILADQHYQYLRETLQPLGVKVDRLVGSAGKKERDGVLQRVAEGICDILVGTHALIQETVVFKALGLAVTDEQHRFGVRQRAMLQHKGQNPHVLVMTATPIPRTLALTLYGDLQLSVIDELPPGRKEIKTIHITEKSRDKLYQFIDKEIVSGRQVYVVCPLVEESEVLDLKAATELAEILSKRFPAYQVGLLHGRQKGQEKELVIDAFRKGHTHILVSTTVVEVGVNVPNASVMVIEGAERFGLAQLHQLRGRVGRGQYQSYCLLVSTGINEDIRRRLGIMCQTNDGFKIAEEDLQIRGPGEFFGTRQHGLPELKIADLLHDGAVLEQARQAAEKMLEDGQLNPLIRQAVEQRFGASSLVRG